MLTRFHPFADDDLLLQRLDQLASLTRTAAGMKQLETSQSKMIRLESIELDRGGVDHSHDKARMRDSSSAPEHDQVDPTQTATHRMLINGLEVWFSGSSLLCRCPGCSAPLTIQVWLGLADCWRCESSMALTAAQLAALHDNHLATVQPLSTLTPSPREMKGVCLDDRPAPPAELSDPLNFSPAPVPVPVPVPAPAIIGWDIDVDVDPRQQELERLMQGSRLVRLVRSGMNLTPAWLVSMLVHLIIILILALIALRDREGVAERITLSTFLSSERELGGDVRIENPDFQLQDDLALASELIQGDKELRDVLQKAQQDARELTQDLRPRVNLPDLTKTRENITHRPDKLMSFAARDPRVRAEMVAQAGGTTLTEAAVARALRWLVSVQNKDGSWSLTNYVKHADPKNKGDVMGTSLALLPLLGAGQTHEYGIYKDAVASGLAWLIENQLPDGDLRAGVRQDAGMYAHGQATIVLCEALALTGDERLRDPAQKAIEFIEQAQHREGGWRYQPGQPGDTSVFGWQMMALQSARSPSLNLRVSDETLQLADYFLDNVATKAKSVRLASSLPEGAAYAYMRGREATPAMTAEAILCRMYLGWDRYDPRLTAAVNWMVKEHLPSEKDRQLYYWYYATQVMHHYGGDPWKTWNRRMREILISTQQTRGRYPGSWETEMCSWGSRGGRIYTTSLACCILEVYYRHLPLFESISLE